MCNKKNKIIFLLLILFMTSTILLIFYSINVEKNIKKDMVYSCPGIIGNAIDEVLYLDNKWETISNVEKLIKLNNIKNEYDKILFIFSHTDIYFSYLKNIKDDIIALEITIGNNNLEFFDKTDLKNMYYDFSTLFNLIVMDDIFKLSSDEINEMFVKVEGNE